MSGGLEIADNFAVTGVTRLGSYEFRAGDAWGRDDGARGAAGKQYNG
jgi:hypothetical protein